MDTQQQGISESPVRSARPAVFVAFLVAFASWLVLDWIHRAFGLSDEAEFLLGVLGPLVTSFAILYPSSLFRHSGRFVRVLRLFLAAAGLLVAAFILWAAFAVVLFGTGAVSPP